MPKKISFSEIALRNGCPALNLLHILGVPFPKSTYGGMLLCGPFPVTLTHQFFPEVLF